MKGKTFIIIFLLILIGGIIMSGIVHKAVKSSGEKGLATEWNDDHEQTGNHDVEQHQFLNQVIENRTDFPAGPVEGQIIYRTDLDTTYIFDGTDWSELSKRVNYWSCPGTKFQAWYPYTQQVNIDGDNGYLYVEANGISVVCSIELPHGATVIGVIVYGSATDESWYLYRIDPADPGIVATMATANIGTEDTSISNAKIDNQHYSYSLQTSTLDLDDFVYGVRIAYTL